MRGRDRRLGAERLLSDVYGGKAQHSAHADVFAHDRYVAQLRFDALLARQIIVTDTHFLGGIFFISCEPAQLLDLVGRGVHRRVLPIEVRTRGNTLPSRQRLAGSIRQLLFRSDRDTLNGFVFHTIADETIRGALASALAATPADRLRRRLSQVEDGQIAESVVRFMRELIGPTEADSDFDRMSAGWAKWLEAERRGDLQTAPWTGSLHLSRALLEDFPPPRGLMTTDVGRATMDDMSGLLSESTHHADARQLLRDTRDVSKAAGEIRELEDLEVIDRWYTVGRFMAEARQHKADLAYSVPPGAVPLNRAESQLRTIRRDSSLADILIPNDLVPGLAGLDGPTNALVTQDVSDLLERVWRFGRVDDVKRLFETLGRHISQHNQQPNLGGKVATVAGLAIAAAVTTSSALAGLGSVATLVSAATGATAPAAQLAIDYVRNRHRQPNIGRVIQYLDQRTYGQT